MLTPEQIKNYRSGWKKRLKAKEDALRLRHESTLKKAGEMARVLKDKYEIKKVVLFGSAA